MPPETRSANAGNQDQPQPNAGNSTMPTRLSAANTSTAQCIESLASLMQQSLLQNEQLIKQLSERDSGRTLQLKETLPSHFSGAPGTDSAEKWISRYEYLCEQNGLKTDGQKVEAFGRYLKEGAWSWYRQKWLPVKDTAEFGALKDDFMQNFGLTKFPGTHAAGVPQGRRYTDRQELLPGVPAPARHGQAARHAYGQETLPEGHQRVPLQQGGGSEPRHPGGCHRAGHSD